MRLKPIVVRTRRLSTWSVNADHVCRPSSWGWVLTIRNWGDYEDCGSLAAPKSTSPSTGRNWWVFLKPFLFRVIAIASRFHQLTLSNSNNNNNSEIKLLAVYILQFFSNKSYNIIPHVWHRARNINFIYKFHIKDIELRWITLSCNVINIITQ